MALHLTPEMVEAQYELLRLTAPFKRWNLPPGDDLAFVILDFEDRYAHFNPEKKFQEIGVSHHLVKNLNLLAQAVAHEMVHLHMERRGISEGKTGHNWRFKRFARAVCRSHQWNLDDF